MAKRSFKKAFKAQDEYYTPSILVGMIVPYLEKWESDFIKNIIESQLFGYHLIRKIQNITRF